MQVNVTDMTERRVLKYARRVGVDLEVVATPSGIGIYGFELTTGLELTDLPGMSSGGCWRSWNASMTGLQQYLRDALGSDSISGAPRGTMASVTELATNHTWTSRR
jgi:hypothetical protein